MGEKITKAKDVAAFFEARGVTRKCPRCTNGNVDFFVTVAKTDALDDKFESPVYTVEVAGKELVFCKCLNCGYVALHELSGILMPAEAQHG